MRKLKSCSFYFIKKSILKKYLLFSFIAVVFITNGFFISPAFASTTIDTDITENTTWTKDGSPYLVSSTVSVVADVTLTIDAGVIVKFNGGVSLFVDGKINAGGTVAEPIYFTSNHDDEVGGSTDGEDYQFCYEDFDENLNDLGEVCETYTYDDGDPYAGDWGGIYFFSSSGSSFKNTFFRYVDDAFYFESSSVNFENLNINKSVSGLLGRVGSHVEILGGNFDNIEKDGFMFFDNSSLILKNVTIKNANSSYFIIISRNSFAIFDKIEISEGMSSYGSPNIGVFDNSSLEINKSKVTSNKDSLQIFRDSSLTATDLSVKCENNGISVFDNGTLNLSGGNISCLNDNIIIFNGSKANISGVKITDALDAGIIAFSNTEPNTINVTNSEITGNNYGFLVYSSPISVNQNSIHDNLSGGTITYDPLAPIIFDFTNNFWGDVSGPTHTTNPNGLGDKVSDNILFAPFLTSDPLKQQQNPVILIPGITGTYLIRNYGDKTEIWPDINKLLRPLGDIFLNDLSLEKDGTENIEMPMKIGDIIRGVESKGIHVFDRLISELIDNGEYVEGEDLFVFPYDWRISTSQNAVLLKEKIDKILLDTGYKNVDIIAHSMGGLIAKKYIVDNGQDKIDQLIFLGTPQFGAPKAFKALMYGDNMGYQKEILNILNYVILSSSRVKYISQNMPSVYELLPSEKYIENNGSYVTDASNEIIDLSSFDLDYLETENLMIEKGRNPLMFSFAKDLHNSIDDLDLSGIETHNFVGCGTKTIGGITVKKERAWEKLFLGWKDDFELKYVNGDETVPLESANKAIGAKMYFASGNTHGSLPSAEGVRQNILSILKGEDLQDYSNILDDASTCNISGDVVSTHSPVELHIYDEEGNHTGPNSDGDIEYGVVGVQYDVIDGENYAFLPDGVNYKIVTKAKDTGGYNFKIEEQDKDDNIIAVYNWTLIPLDTLNTQGEIWIGPDYPTSDYSVKTDKDGNGTIDENYKAFYDGTTEAEIATAPHRKFSSGSIPQISLIPVTAIQNLEIKTPELEPVQEKQELAVNTVTITDIDKGESINKEKVEDSQIKQDIIKDDDIEQNNLSASVGDSGVEIDLLWPAIILFGFIGVSLAKMFIKL